MSTVNGSIRIDENTVIDGYVETVNGSIKLAKGSSVSNHVSNVNGEIEVIGSEVGADLSTVNGDIWLGEGTVVKGDVIVEKPGGSNWFSRNNRDPKVVIGPGASVGGEIRLERKVRLYISNSATVGGVQGEMSMDDAIRFDGARP